MFDDDEEELQHIREAAERLQASRARLHLTIRDIKHNRRTPGQREAIRKRSAMLIHRSELIHRRIRKHLAVH